MELIVAISICKVVFLLENDITHTVFLYKFILFCVILLLISSRSWLFQLVLGGSSSLQVISACCCFYYAQKLFVIAQIHISLKTDIFYDHLLLSLFVLLKYHFQITLLFDCKAMNKEISLWYSYGSPLLPVSIRTIDEIWNRI